MKTITTQQTSKKFKLLLVIFNLALIAAPIWAFCVKCQAEISSSDPNYIPPLTTFIIAVVGNLITRFLIWWNHG